MKQEHYDQLFKIVAEQVRTKPTFELDAQLNGDSPRAARWGLISASGLVLDGDPNSAITPVLQSHLPLYSYMDLRQIDDTLCSIMLKLGCSYAAQPHDTPHRPAKPFQPGNRVLPDSEFQAEILDLGNASTTVCKVGFGGNLLVDKLIRDKLHADPERFRVKDVDGGTHAIGTVGNETAFITDYRTFSIAHSEYEVQSCELVYGPNTEVGEDPDSVSEGESAKLTLDELRTRAEQLGVTQFGAWVLLADQKSLPDGSATTSYIKVNVINGIAGHLHSFLGDLGHRLGLAMAPDFEAEVRQKGPRMG